MDVSGAKGQAFEGFREKSGEALQLLSLSLDPHTEAEVCVERAIAAHRALGEALAKISPTTEALVFELRQNSGLSSRAVKTLRDLINLPKQPPSDLPHAYELQKSGPITSIPDLKNRVTPNLLGIFRGCGKNTVREIMEWSKR